MGKAGQFFPEFCIKFIRNSPSHLKTVFLSKYLGYETSPELMRVSNVVDFE
jgi:hypothetical protein